MEQTVWDLTEEEIKALKEMQSYRGGKQKLLEELILLSAREVDRENAWWESVRMNHNIPKNVQLTASSDTGKLWIKGYYDDERT